MTDLDEIIDKYATPIVKPEQIKQALTNVTKSFDVRYKCVDGYEVTFNEVKCKAFYHFPGYGPFEADITMDQRNYFLKTKYWVPV